MDAKCPSGYRFQSGDIDGLGNPSPIFSQIFPNETIQDCGARCNQHEECKTLEWSDSTKRCVLLTTNVPDNKKYQDYILCSKIKGYHK